MPTNKPGIVRNFGEVLAEMGSLNMHKFNLEKYAADCDARKDRHGVRDAMADIESTEAAISALAWVIGDRETTGR